MPQPGVTCSTCPAWYSDDDGEGGECHGEPPFLFLLPAPVNPIDPTAKRGIDVKRTFRPTLHDDWCGKHPRFDWNVEPDRIGRPKGAA